MQEYSRGGSVRWEAVIAVGVANADFEPSDHTGLSGALEPGPHLKQGTLSERLDKKYSPDLPRQSSWCWPSLRRRLTF